MNSLACKKTIFDIEKCVQESIKSRNTKSAYERCKMAFYAKSMELCGVPPNWFI